MKTCIICRVDKENFNDEHVIPDSIQGYYHIFSVCVECNSKLGSNIDSTLTNHKFIEFQRHMLNIKGKSGSVPNPLKGVHIIKDKPEEKIFLNVNENGEFVPHLLPIIPDLKADSFTDSFTIVIDKKDEKKIDSILEKLLKRNGIDKSKITSTKEYHKTNPCIHTKLQIDIHDFKAGILKIAYEFAIDSIPEYFDDPEAIKISKILFNADFENLTKEITFLGNGFDKIILDPFKHLIEFENNNHYLILTPFSKGLLCVVNLFNTFSIGILISKKSTYLKDNIIIGKNDLTNHTFKKYDIKELLKSTYTPIEYRFQHWFPDLVTTKEFIEIQKDPKFGYYYEANGEIAFYNKAGKIVYNNIDEKLKEMRKIQKGDVKNEMITEFILDEEVYIKLLPSLNLYQIISVQIEQYNSGKI